MHKTGSTAIQNWLHYSRLPGARYFRWRAPNHSDLFVLLFEDDPEKYFPLATRGYTKERAEKERERERQRIRKQIERSRKDVFIFSAERISTAPEAAVAEMQKFFSEMFSDIQVYAYVRKPSSFMASMVQQHMKTGDFKFELENLWPYYRRRFDKLLRVFGEENVHLRSFDALAENGREAVGDFADWVGLSAVPPKNIVENRSMNATGMALLFFYRKIVEPTTPVDQRALFDEHLLDAVQKKVPGEKFQVALNHGARRPEWITSDMEWISERLGVDVDDLDLVKKDVRVFRREDDILDHAVGMSHLLVPGTNADVLDPKAVGSVEATCERFEVFLSHSGGFRARLRRWLKKVKRGGR